MKRAAHGQQGWWQHWLPVMGDVEDNHHPPELSERLGRQVRACRASAMEVSE